MTTTPMALIVFWIIIEKYNGSVWTLAEKVQVDPQTELARIWAQVFIADSSHSLTVAYA